MCFLSKQLLAGLGWRFGFLKEAQWYLFTWQRWLRAWAPRSQNRTESSENYRKLNASSGIWIKQEALYVCHAICKESVDVVFCRRRKVLVSGVCLFHLGFLSQWWTSRKSDIWQNLTNLLIKFHPDLFITSEASDHSFSTNSRGWKHEILPSPSTIFALIGDKHPFIEEEFAPLSFITCSEEN